LVARDRQCAAIRQKVVLSSGSKECFARRSHSAARSRQYVTAGFVLWSIGTPSRPTSRDVTDSFYLRLPKSRRFVSDVGQVTRALRGPFGQPLRGSKLRDLAYALVTHGNDNPRRAGEGLELTRSEYPAGLHRPKGHHEL